MKKSKNNKKSLIKTEKKLTKRVENSLTKRAETTKKNKKRVLDALKKTLGVVSSACQKVDLNPTTFYSWLKNDEEFAKEVKMCKELAIDTAETSLMEQIKDGNTAATIFYLKTQGRDRGYVERLDIAQVNFDVEFLDLKNDDKN